MLYNNLLIITDAAFFFPVPFLFMGLSPCCVLLYPPHHHHCTARVQHCLFCFHLGFFLRTLVLVFGKRWSCAFSPSSSSSPFPFFLEPQLCVRALDGKREEAKEISMESRADVAWNS